MWSQRIDQHIAELREQADAQRAAADAPLVHDGRTHVAAALEFLQGCKQRADDLSAELATYAEHQQQLGIAQTKHDELATLQAPTPHLPPPGTPSRAGSCC